MPSGGFRLGREGGTGPVFHAKLYLTKTHLWAFVRFLLNGASIWPVSNCSVSIWPVSISPVSNWAYVRESSVAYSLWFLAIFVGVRWWGGIKWECGRRKCEFSLSITIFRMKFPTGFTHRNLHGFARFPGDSMARLNCRVCIATHGSALRWSELCEMER